MLHLARKGLFEGGEGAYKVEMIAQALLSDWHGFKSQLCYLLSSWVILDQLLNCLELHLESVVMKLLLQDCPQYQVK